MIQLPIEVINLLSTSEQKSLLEVLKREGELLKSIISNYEAELEIMAQKRFLLAQLSDRIQKLKK